MSIESAGIFLRLFFSLSQQEIIALTVHIFNPQTDFALACDRRYYTPPKRVETIIREFCLTPRFFASPGDSLLIPDGIGLEDINDEPAKEFLKKKNINLLPYSCLKEISCEVGRVNPWGWNRALRRFLIESEIEERLIPSEESINDIRRLSHRRTSILFQKELKRLNSEFQFAEAEELKTVKEVEEFIEHDGEVFLKEPWSSSGRGVVTNRELNHKLIMEWAWGSIRRQESVIAEKAWRKKADFATEWYYEGGEAYFLGFSFFRTLSDGRFRGNMIDDQEKILNKILEAAPGFTSQLLGYQKSSLESVFKFDYTGPLGIDMLSDKEGNINPCVEINVRWTMGHVAIAENRFRKENINEVSDYRVNNLKRKNFYGIYPLDFKTMF